MPPKAYWWIELDFDFRSALRFKWLLPGHKPIFTNVNIYSQISVCGHDDWAFELIAFFFNDPISKLTFSMYKLFSGLNLNVIHNKSKLKALKNPTSPHTLHLSIPQFQPMSNKFSYSCRAKPEAEIAAQQKRRVHVVCGLKFNRFFVCHFSRQLIFPPLCFLRSLFQHRSDEKITRHIDAITS